MFGWKHYTGTQNQGNLTLILVQVPTTSMKKQKA